MHVNMTADDLGQPAALTFRATADEDRIAIDVRQIEALWGKPEGKGRIGRNDWLRAWRNIRVLASRLLDGLDPQGRCEPETFQHLLLAVGNFKRQAGDIHLPVDLADWETEWRSESLVLPGGLGRLDRDDVASWQRLDQIPGLGVPTATCLLAALWPDRHAIMDVLDRRATIGFQVGRHSYNDQRLDAALVPSREWWFYDWFRRTVMLTAQAADCEPVLVERALYILGARTARELGDMWEQRGTWSEYHRAVLSQADRLLRP